jgi:hypothetical protein
MLRYKCPYSLYKLEFVLYGEKSWIFLLNDFLIIISSNDVLDKHILKINLNYYE